MSVRQYVISDPATIKYNQTIRDRSGTPTFLWQQQIEKSRIRTYKIVSNFRPDRHYELDYTKDYETQFRPLQMIEEYNPQFWTPCIERIRIEMTFYMTKKI